MAHQKQSLQQTLQIICDILNFETAPNTLKQHVDGDEIDWDAIVVIASKHLVLPALYCRLEQESMLEYLPEDLINYLKELTELNRQRNCTLLEEVRKISNLFNEHQIDHVFIKGTALLAGKYFKDMGERMIGDIDILVASEDLNSAFSLLVDEGYSQFVAFNYEVKNYRHKPRQISKDRLGAIELHDQLLKYGYNNLIDKNEFLSTKELVDGIAIPNSENLIRNSILAQQINDQLYYFGRLNLKGVYDILVLHLSHKKELLTVLEKQKYSLRFLALTSVLIKGLKLEKTKLYRYYTTYYRLALQYPKIGYLIYRTKFISITLQERLKLLFFNHSYRLHLINNKILKFQRKN